MTTPPLFVDTNVFLRFLTRDEPRQAEECRRLFERAEAGELHLTTSHLALAEIAWTLQSYYRLPREEIAAVLRDVLSLRSLRIDYRDMLREAISHYRARNVDFIDAYHAADIRRRKLSQICSYDRDFDTLDVARVEPAAAI